MSHFGGFSIKKSIYLLKSVFIEKLRVLSLQNIYIYKNKHLLGNVYIHKREKMPSGKVEVITN